MPQSAKILKVYIGETYRTGGIPTHEQIVYLAHKHKIAGATMIKGAEGMGHVGVIQHKDDAYNHDMPVIIEIIDATEKIEAFIPVIVEAVGNHGLIAVSDVSIIHKGVPSGIPRAKDPEGNEIKSF
jgi:PII-like signaling protein